MKHDETREQDLTDEFIVEVAAAKPDIVGVTRTRTPHRLSFLVHQLKISAASAFLWQRRNRTRVVLRSAA